MKAAQLLVRPPRVRRPVTLWGAALLSAGLLGGVLWSQAPPQEGPVSPAGRLSGDFHALRALPDGRLLYGQQAGVSVSADGGRTWSAPDGAGDAMTLSISPRVPGVLVLAGHDVLKISRNSGGSWQEASFGNLASTDLHGFAVAPDMPNVWYANIAGLGLYRTEDGRNWKVMSPATAGAMTLTVGPGSTPRLYALTRMDGLIVSDDGRTWQRAEAAPQAAATGLDVHPVSGNVYLAGPGGVARSTDQGASWVKLGLPEGALLVTSDPQDEGQMYAVGESGVVYRSVDGGNAWSR